MQINFEFMFHLISDSEFLITMALLNGLVVPTCRKMHILEDGKKQLKKYTISDAIVSIFYEFATTQQVTQFLEFNRNKEKKKIQPFLIIMSTLFKVQKIYLFIDSIKYEFDSAIRAFDILFKSYFVFHFKYPDESYAFWHFVQLYLYNIQTKFDTKNSAVKLLIRELNLMNN